LVISAGTGLIFAIGCSRLLLDAHCVPEVGLELVNRLSFFSPIPSPAPPNMKMWPSLVTAGVVLSIFHGRELHAEQFLRRIAGILKSIAAYANNAENAPS
jgi:hypothetical protein